VKELQPAADRLHRRACVTRQFGFIGPVFWWHLQMRGPGANGLDLWRTAIGTTLAGACPASGSRRLRSGWRTTAGWGFRSAPTRDGKALATGDEADDDPLRAWSLVQGNACRSGRLQGLDAQLRTEARAPHFLATGWATGGHCAGEFDRSPGSVHGFGGSACLPLRQGYGLRIGPLAWRLARPWPNAAARHAGPESGVGCRCAGANPHGARDGAGSAFALSSCCCGLSGRAAKGVRGWGDVYGLALLELAEAPGDSPNPTQAPSCRPEDKRFQDVSIAQFTLGWPLITSLGAFLAGVLLLATGVHRGAWPMRLGAASRAALPDPTLDRGGSPGPTQTALLAGGCFWGYGRRIYEEAGGVKASETGYQPGLSGHARYVPK